MITFRILFFIFQFLSTSVAYGNGDSYVVKTLYGEDNRVEAPLTDHFHLREARHSVAAKVSPQKIQCHHASCFIQKITPAQKAYNLCPDENFSHQPSLSKCSGFLVGNDLLLTAGHCLRKKNRCDNDLWIFDYTYNETSFSTAQIYTCKEVLF
mgnify:CR=1 FL=1